MSDFTNVPGSGRIPKAIRELQGASTERQVEAGPNMTSDKTTRGTILTAKATAVGRGTSSSQSQFTPRWG